MATVAKRRATLVELGSEQLAALAAVNGMTAELPRMRHIFQALLGENARAGLGTPAYPSDVVDDHTPYELSLAIGGGTPELRMLVEPNDGDPSLAGRWRAGRAACSWLRDAFGADLSRLEQVADLFEPKREHGLFALWHAIVFRPERAPEAKVYLDLRARGAAEAPAVLEEALARLGLARAYPRLLADAGRRGPVLDELVYFSLDLARHDRARVKVYFRHHGAVAADLEAVVGARGGVHRGEVAAFLDTVLGHAGPYLARPPVSCWSFTDTDEPSGATLYAPIAYYVRDDAEARERVLRWLAGRGLDEDAYDRSLAAFARRPLDRGVGLHSYISCKCDGGKPKVTAYLAPEAYRTFEPGELAARAFAPPARPTTAPAFVAFLETEAKADRHPLFLRLAREPAAIAPVWTILANNWVGIGDRFPRWLAALVSRVEDDRVRSILAKQLDDELGHGDPSRAHRLLFERMLADLEPCAPPVAAREHLLGPGRRLRDELGASYTTAPELEAIGGTLVAEVFGKQVDQAIGALLRRPDRDHRELDTDSLTWLVQHETLEEDHADESMTLARLMPGDAATQAALVRGAEAIVRLAHRYFDDLYGVIFG